jgi:hypothetical protein
MRDLIWTLIVVWLVMLLVDLYRVSVSRKTTSQSTGSAFQGRAAHTHPPHNPDKLKKAVREHVNKEGEYVDFEEVK